MGFAVRAHCIAVCLLTCTAALAQVASLTGRITDPSGAVIPQASVTATATATGTSASSESNGEGLYTLPSLQPGLYELSVTKAGFVPLRQTGLELTVQQVARIDLTMRVGQMNEVVEVMAVAPVLDSESTTVGQVIGNKQVSELPLLGRNTYALAILTPGVRASVGVNNLVIDQISTVAYSINGQRGNSNEFLLDGAPNSAPMQNQPVINANPDMVQEFKVETNNFSAEYGRAAGGVFNVVTKSGTNDPHFSLYEFFRNDKLNANDFFANRARIKRAPFRFNQFGGTFGGPVVIPKLYNGRNKTFFFTNVELVRFIQGVTFTATLPDPNQLTGNFSNARLTDGRLVTIYDPATTAASPTGGFTRTAFPGNIIPANRISPVARAVARLFPAPTTPNAPLGTTNYTRTDGNRVDKNSYSLRFDHHFSERNRLFGRYSYDDTPFNRAPVYGRDFANIAPTAGPQVFTRSNTVVEDTHTFSPTMLGTFRYSVTRLVNFRRPYSDNFDLTSLGLPSYLAQGIVDPLSLPAIQIQGYGANSSIPNIIVGGVIGATDLIRFGGTTHSFMGNVTKILSGHTFKAGGEYRVIQFNNQQTGDAATNFSFSPQWTQGPNPNQSSAIAGLSLATFLLGIPSGGVNPAPALALTTKYYAAFLQDAWKVSSKLTVNWGVRYDYETPRTDRFNQLTNFDFDAPSPLQAAGLNVRGGLTFVGQNGASRYNANPDRNNVAPRLGIAYRLTPKTVIRTGAGLFYATSTGIGGGAGPFGVSGFQAATSIVTSLDGVTPVVNWSDPYPNGFNSPSGASQGLGTLLGQSIQFYDRGNKTPYSAQWNFNIQRELPGAVVFEVGYVGTRGLNLLENLVLNQLPAGQLALGDALRTQIPNPFFGQITVGPLANRTVARAQLLRPYPQFDGVNSQAASWASSSYHSLQMRAEKRYVSGLTMLGTYTWSKFLDYGTGPFGGETLGGGNFQDNNNRAANWASSTLDQTHRVTANAVYELPFFRTANGWKRTVLGGWQFGGIWTAYSGGPLGVTSNVNNTFSQGGAQRPNWNGQNPCAADPTPDRWLDPSVFSNPPAYAFGTAPRTFNGCRSDSISQIDATITKNTRFGERFNIQFRAEAFNLVNSVRFSPPNTAFGNPQFGIVNAQQNQPRVIQFGMKLLF